MYTDDLTTEFKIRNRPDLFQVNEGNGDLFKDYPEAIKSTLEVAEKCNLELDTKANHMPRFPIPDESGAKNLNEYLEKLLSTKV